MLKFNDNNIYIGYIKQLLKSFNLPRCQVYNKEKSSAYDDTTLYIKENALYRGNKQISLYNFNDKILNVTDNYHINSNIYDSETHKYLGDYLRFIRDYTGLDLMQLYNCFTNESPVNLHLDNFDVDDEKYQIFILPIKFNQKYTIGLDCSGEVLLGTCNYENRDLVENNIQHITKSYSGARFNHPFVFESQKVTSAEMLREESTLKLLIRVPFNCRSSIVVLEGDYTRGCELYTDKSNEEMHRQVLASTIDTSKEKNGNLVKYVFKDEQGKEHTSLINYYISRPQLLYLNSGEHYLLADRLIEYLSRNVIDSNEEIGENIKLVQKEISTVDFTKKYLDDIRYRYAHFGVWNDEIRQALYNYIFKSKDTPDKIQIINNYFDLLGFYDKDVESTLRYVEKTELDNSYER